MDNPNPWYDYAIGLVQEDGSYHAKRESSSSRMETQRLHDMDLAVMMAILVELRALVVAIERLPDAMIP